MLRESEEFEGRKLGEGRREKELIQIPMVFATRGMIHWTFLTDDASAVCASSLDRQEESEMREEKSGDVLVTCP